MIPEAFVMPGMRDRFEADQKAVQDVDWRDRVHQIISDAIEQTGGR